MVRGPKTGRGKGFPKADETWSFSLVQAGCTAKAMCADAVFPKSLLDDYKDYGVNCDKMASEIEDHILELCWGCGCLDCAAAGLPKAGDTGQRAGRGKGPRDSPLLCPTTRVLHSV